MQPADYILKHRIAPGRKHYPRVEVRQGVWVYWNSEKLEDTSRVRDLSLGGLFIESEEARAVGTTIRLDFLVQEARSRPLLLCATRSPDEEWA